MVLHMIQNIFYWSPYFHCYSCILESKFTEMLYMYTSSNKTLLSRQNVLLAGNNTLIRTWCGGVDSSDQSGRRGRKLETDILDIGISHPSPHPSLSGIAHVTCHWGRMRSRGKYHLGGFGSGWRQLFPLPFLLWRLHRFTFHILSKFFFVFQNAVGFDLSVVKGYQWWAVLFHSLAHWRFTSGRWDWDWWTGQLVIFQRWVMSSWMW